MALTLSGSTDTGYGVAGDTNGVRININGVTKATFDTSGNFGLGVTPSAWDSGWKALQLNANGVMFANGSNATYFANNYYLDGANAKYLTSNFATSYGQVSGAHIWYTAAAGTAGNAITFTQAMTLNASGNVQIGTATDAARLTVSHAAVGGTGIDVRTTGSDATPINIYSRITAAGSTSNFHLAGQAGGADKVYIYGNGNIVNVNNSYGTLSDAGIKTVMGPASSQWEDIKALEPLWCKFVLNDDETGLVQLGGVAQDFQKVCPGVVFETTKDGKTILGINYSVLYMKGLKALGEALHKIDELAAEVAALKAK